MDPVTVGGFKKTRHLFHFLSRERRINGGTPVDPVLETVSVAVEPQQIDTGSFHGFQILFRGPAVFKSTLKIDHRGNTAQRHDVLTHKRQRQTEFQTQRLIKHIIATVAQHRPAHIKAPCVPVPEHSVFLIPFFDLPGGDVVPEFDLERFSSGIQKDHGKGQMTLKDRHGVAVPFAGGKFLPLHRILAPGAHTCGKTAADTQIVHRVPDAETHWQHGSNARHRFFRDHFKGMGGVTPFAVFNGVAQGQPGNAFALIVGKSRLHHHLFVTEFNFGNTAPAPVAFVPPFPVAVDGKIQRRRQQIFTGTVFHHGAGQLPRCRIMAPGDVFVPVKDFPCFTFFHTGRGTHVKVFHNQNPFILSYLLSKTFCNI